VKRDPVGELGEVCAKFEQVEGEGVSLFCEFLPHFEGGRISPQSEQH
jgi:hypothetical protein